MTIRHFSRISEIASNTPSAGTAFNLPGTAPTGYRTFASKYSNTWMCPVFATNGTDWEELECTFTTGTPNTLALPIDRAEMNYIFNTFCQQLQQYQQYGCPEFITAANNGGTAFPYDFMAEVFYSSSGNPPFDKYVSVVPGTGTNTSVPGADANWVKLSAPTGMLTGDSRNAKMTVSAASSTATFSADELVVSRALGDQSIKLASFNESINLATTGAGGMDTGAAPASGFVALYAIHDPTTAISALLAVNATSAVAPEVYGGANMPAGYTMSALVSVWPTNASSQFVIGRQAGRSIKMIDKTAFNWSALVTTPTLVSISTIVPLNAKSISGIMTTSITTSHTGGLIVMSLTMDINGVGHSQSFTDVQTAGTPTNSDNFTMDINASQIYATLTTTATGITAVHGSMAISGYSI